MRFTFFLILIALFILPTQAQYPGYWQQAANYEMDVHLNVSTNILTGKQKITYQNNSPDTLKQVFYHLYFNAFQPGSMMDVRSRTIEDPDRRVRDRIFYLNPSQIGYQKIISLKQDGKPLNYEVEETILEVELNKALRPGKKTVLEMEFEAQVPLQIRRSGRDNEEGIRYSMSQWYPKLCEYDKDGWAAIPYIAREFHGVWGDFEVKITLDSSYMVAASGVLQNPKEIGHGYIDASQVKRKASSELTWVFQANNVHDFVWAADPDYTHLISKKEGAPDIHFFYQKDTSNSYWDTLAKVIPDVFIKMKEPFGEYPYPIYSIIQGGDGGMEYPMATLITGKRSLGSLIGVSTHEILHSWYQMVLATNEGKYPWMDEGFNSFAEEVINHEGKPNDRSSKHQAIINGYVNWVKGGKEEALNTHADHYVLNRAYSINAYTKGAVMLVQLQYIMGDEVFFQAFKEFYNVWKFKHPTPDDLKRIMERRSGLELDWFFEYWIGSTNVIDYAIRAVVPAGNKTVVTLEKLGGIPMPIELLVKDKSGNSWIEYIPLEMMRGTAKNKQFFVDTVNVRKDWPWTHPFAEVTLNVAADQIESIEIDASKYMADVNRSNNHFPFSKDLSVIID